MSLQIGSYWNFWKLPILEFIKSVENRIIGILLAMQYPTSNPIPASNDNPSTIPIFHTSYKIFFYQKKLNNLVAI